LEEDIEHTFLQGGNTKLSKLGLQDGKIIEKSPEEIKLVDEAILKIARSVERKIRSMEFEDDDIISSDTIRGLVASKLYKIGEKDVARTTELVGLKNTEIVKIWSGDSYADNANLNGKTPETMHKYLADGIAKKATLNLFPDEIRDAHLKGRIHIHDLEYFATRPFCNEHDLRYYLYYGLYADGSGDTIPVASPAKSASVAVLHAAKALGSASSNFSGGQGYQNFLTFISPYLQGMTYKEIKQLMQMYIYEMSQMMNARGGQAVFSTTQLTPGVPEIFRDVPVVYQGKIWDGVQTDKRITYGRYEREVRLAFKAYTEVMYNGDAFGRPFSFPKYEIELLPEHWVSENWDNPLPGEAPSYKELWLDMCRLITKDGTPYIHNALNTQKGSINCYSCCAYEFQSSQEADPDFHDKLNFVDGKHFVLGSLQVGTINLPQAAYASQGNFDLFMNHIKESIWLLVDVFRIKQSYLSRQALPFARQTPTDFNDKSKRAPPLWDEKALPYVIGIVGLNEAVQVLCGKQIHEGYDAHQIAVKVLTYIQIAVNDAAKESGLKISFARTPAETTAQRFAVCDLLNGYSDTAKNYIKGDVKYALYNLKSSKDLPIYYTNGAMVADGYCISLADKIHLEEHAFAAFDGGNIFHIFLGEGNANPEAILDFIVCLTKRNIKYFTFTLEYSVCRECNTLMKGLKDSCEYCGSSDVTQFSRITGYIQAIKGTKISGWNKGKVEELRNRDKHVIGVLT
jgi:ribonucleoside-triphosphate reductase (formate)